AEYIAATEASMEAV
ncbi:hypothetical protein Tco_0435591, partial [Tanacetum coccineum]